ncbi:MAG: SDR family NAD(P)-dependent oxidoreductase [Limisphaerales bacterium]
MNPTPLPSRIAVITGGARGIGLAIAHRLAASGASCSLWDRDAESLARAVTSFPDGSRVQPVLVDVTDDSSVEKASRSTLDHFGGIDILVNNAGIAGASKPTWELSPTEWREVIAIDLVGVFLCCRAVVPHMLRRGSGRIVNIASIAGKEGNPNASHYSAAKAGVIALTKSLGKELATSGILVNAIAPAVIETEMLGQMSARHVEYMRSKIPMDRFGRKEEAAALVAWLCSEECSFSTGAVYDLSGGRATY